MGCNAFGFGCWPNPRYDDFRRREHFNDYPPRYRCDHCRSPYGEFRPRRDFRPGPPGPFFPW